MFRKRNEEITPVVPAAPIQRVTSVLGTGIIWKGDLSGSGGVRIEGAFEGGIVLRGMLVVGETGRVTSEHIKANTVIIAGAVRGDITAEKVEIRSTGRVWGNVITASFATEEGAFLRGQIQMEEQVEISIPSSKEATAEKEEIEEAEEAEELDNEGEPEAEDPV